MFADEERDELEGPDASKSDEFTDVSEPDALDSGADAPCESAAEDTGEFLDSAPPLTDAIAPIASPPPDEDAVEDWVTVEMPRSKSNGPGEDPDDATPAEEITPVEEMPKVPGAGVVVEPAAPPVEAPAAPDVEPAAETLGAPAPAIDPEPEPAPPAAVPPAPAASPIVPPVVPPKPAEPAPAASPPPVSAPPVSAAPDTDFLGPIGRGLSGIGIRDRRAQQWVSAGLAAVLLACCTCSCMVAIALTSFTTVGG